MAVPSPEPSRPPAHPTRPIRSVPSAIGGPRVVGSTSIDGATWLVRLRGLAEQFDEEAVLAALDPAERAEVRAQVQRETAASIVALGWLAFPIFVLLLRMDILRYAEGLMSGEGIEAWSYRVLTLGHALVGLAAVPAFLIARRRRRAPLDASLDLQALHVTLILTAATLMSVLGLVARGTTYGFTVAMIVGNLIYHLPHRGRWVFNTLAVTIAALWTLGVDQVVLRDSSVTPLTDVTRLVEIIIVLLLTILTGSMVRRQRLRSVAVEQRLSRLALVDGLTGVASRRRTEEVLADALAAAEPTTPLSVILVDLDDFKQVNDTYGHNAGDDVLRGVARLLQQRGRLSDTVGRWGGEEFVVICPDTPVTGALGLAEQLRDRIARQAFVGLGQQTASFGVAQAVPGDTVDDVIARADAALYEAKGAGRNRVREAARP